MIIQLDYSDNGLYAIKTTYNKKEKYHYIRYIVDEFSIDRAIEDIKDNKYVVALDYEGDLQYLFTLKERPDVPLIVTKEFKEINELSIAFYMQKFPDWVTVSIMTPENFCDMRLIEVLSLKYPNIRFCGGKFLRLPSCNVGCIMHKDIPDKIAESKIQYSTEGCACIITTMPIDEVQNVEFIYREDKVKTEEKKEETKKRVINNLEELFGV